MPDSVEDTSTISLRICLEGHANALALNKDNNQIALAGRSCKIRIAQGLSINTHNLLPNSA